jgi:hypothetical protein
MPVISELSGDLKIVIYTKDHLPPHAHVLKRDRSMARIEIPSMEIHVDKDEFRGQLLKEVDRWTKEHGRELTENWDLIQTTGHCRPVRAARGRH